MLCSQLAKNTWNTKVIRSCQKVHHDASSDVLMMLDSWLGTGHTRHQLSYSTKLLFNKCCLMMTGTLLVLDKDIEFLSWYISSPMVKGW